MTEHEPIIRLSASLSVFVAMALWEVAAPRRPQRVPRGARWPANLLIAILSAVLVRILFPAAAVGVAAVADANDWGLFRALRLPEWFAVPSAFLLLDFALYLQHRAFHAYPPLWRLHRMHHADLEIDVTTGARFHPFEILLSMLIKMGIIVLLGAPIIAVLIFEIVLNASSTFNHANARLGSKLDGVLRWFLVTPDMHRIHHSIIPRETNSNFGFNLTWWDRALRTYREEPAAGQTGMTIGIEQFRDVRELRLKRMLLQPFRPDDGRYPRAR